MADDAKKAWNDVGERFASVGKRLSQRYREMAPSGEAGAREAQRKLEDAAKEVSDQITRALDALGTTIGDEAAKADLKQAVTAVGHALGTTFDEAGEGGPPGRGAEGRRPPPAPPPPP